MFLHHADPQAQSASMRMHTSYLEKNCRSNQIPQESQEQVMPSTSIMTHPNRAHSYSCTDLMRAQTSARALAYNAHKEAEIDPIRLT